jgi:hypothetical protein
MAAKGLPRDPTNPARFKHYHGKMEFELFYLSDWKGLTQDQIKIMRDVWPHLVRSDSWLVVESLPDGRSKLTFRNANVMIVCDPRDDDSQKKAREQLIGCAAKKLGLTRSPFRNLVARTMLYLSHFGYI